MGAGSSDVVVVAIAVVEVSKVVVVAADVWTAVVSVVVASAEVTDVNSVESEVA